MHGGLSLQVDDAQYFSLHTHSKYSSQDALPDPAEVVARAKELGYRGLGMTDHGNIAASIELYRECMAAGIKPFPGSELYIVPDRSELSAKGHKFFHIGMVAYTTQGYRNLIKISTQSHKNYYFKPCVDLADFAKFHEDGWTEGIALLTGCHFGLVQQTLRRQGYEAGLNLVRTLSRWFDVYVELQNHQIVHPHEEGERDLSEDQIADELVRIADDVGLEVVITQDSHYTLPADKRDHETLKRLVSYGSGSDDAVFPGDGFHLVGDGWMRSHHSDDHYARGIQGLDHLLARHDLRISEADEYRYRVPHLTSDPDGDFRRRVFSGLFAKGLLKPRYLNRIEEELAVITEAGFAEYMMLVVQICDFMTEQGIVYQTRGSAAGGLCCYASGITNVDPIKHHLVFDRFLSRDRTKPPDVDLDIQQSRRPEVLAWVAQRFSVTQLCTWAEMKLKEDDEDGGKGALLVKYFSKRARVTGEKGGGWETVPRRDRQDLIALANRQVFSGYGVHPCAVAVMNSSTELESMLPMQWVASSETMVSQYDGDVIESLGIVKADLLGLRMLDILKTTCDMVGMTWESLQEVTLTDPKPFTMIRRGDTAGMFQLEGGTASRGCREVGPHRLSEVIDILALYRPAVMNSGATASYVARKAGDEEVPQRHSLLMKHTTKTRGLLLFQDQVIAILRELDLTPDELTASLKAIKASNQNVGRAGAMVRKYLPLIESRCRALGFDDHDWKFLHDGFLAYAEYGFNLAHATVYGLTAYRCAWLASHHGAAYHAALLAHNAGRDKETQYVYAARRRGYRIRRPDLNRSGFTYTLDGETIRRGLLAIEHLGPAAAHDLVAGQPYASWEDFITKSVGTKISGVNDFTKKTVSKRPTTETVKGTVKALYLAGAFKDSIGDPPFQPILEETA